MVRKTFERKDAKFPGYGAFWFMLGALLFALSLSDVYEIAAVFLTLTLGYSAATIFGIIVPIFSDIIDARQLKALGIYHFFSPSCLLVGWIGVPLAILAAIVESLLFPFDDNLLIPIIAALFFIIT
jgi:dolichol kinase